MNYEVVLKLISPIYTENERKQQIKTGENVKAVFGCKKSIGSNEFFKAGQSGLKPQFVIEISTADYENEKIVEVNSKRYAVYRTYDAKNELTELYLTEKSGV